MADAKYSYEQLSEICDRLQGQVSRHVMVEQDLILTKDALDREIARFTAMQSYSQRALQAQSIEEVTTVSLESVAEAFEFEVSALFRYDYDSGCLELVGQFGFDEFPGALPFDVAALAADESRIFAADELSFLSSLGLVQAIMCPFSDHEGRLYGVVLGGRTEAKKDFYDAIGEEVRSSFAVMALQIGGLWLNYQLNVLVRERKYSVLFHRSNDAVFLLDLHGHIHNSNERARELFGYDDEEMKSLTAIDLHDESVHNEARSMLASLADAGSLRFETCCVTKDGVKFPAEVSASIYDGDGQPMVHGLVRDITELRRSQRQLIQSERLAALGQLIAGIAHEINTPIGVIRASIGNISSSLGETLESLPALIKRLPSELLESFFHLLERARTGDRNLTSREERKRKRALAKTLESHGLANADEVADTLVDMAIYDDVDNLLPLLTSNIPMVLQSAYNLSSLQRNSENIRTAVERASKVVFALKKFAHHDRSGNKIPSDIVDSVETVLTLYHNKLKQGVEVIRNFEALPPVPCYPDELHQVWTNLVHNALHAMDNKGRLEVSVLAGESDVVVSIADDGPGIPKEIREHIFEPFFTTKAAGEGTGLGLDICHKIVERHGGRIELQSKPGRTIFSVFIPVVEDADA
jgi:PAS domain S-box-containing protein